MNSFRKIFGKSDTKGELKGSLKHSHSMPFNTVNGSVTQGRRVIQPPDEPRLVYRGKRPLKTSDVVVYMDHSPEPEPKDYYGDTYTSRNMLNGFPPSPSNTYTHPRATSTPYQETVAKSTNESSYIVQPLQVRKNRAGSGRQPTTLERGPSNASSYSRPTASAYPSLSSLSHKNRGDIRVAAKPKGARDAPSTRHRAVSQPSSMAPSQFHCLPLPPVPVLKDVSANIPPSLPPKNMARYAQMHGGTPRNVDALMDGRDVRYAAGRYVQPIFGEVGEDWEVAEAQRREALRQRAVSMRSRRSGKSAARIY